jgi:hypothetical protein
MQLLYCYRARWVFALHLSNYFAHIKQNAPVATCPCYSALPLYYVTLMGKAATLRDGDNIKKYFWEAGSRMTSVQATSYSAREPTELLADTALPSGDCSKGCTNVCVGQLDMNSWHLPKKCIAPSRAYVSSPKRSTVSPDAAWEPRPSVG